MAEAIEGEAVEMSQELEPLRTAPATLFGTDDPDAVIERATRMADALMNVVKQKRLAKRIGPRDYLLVEAWTCLGSLVGVYARTAWSKPLEDGWEAKVDVVTRDGMVIGGAEAECLRSEKNWKNRDDYALRSMAQTRAMGKALRMTLGFIAVLAGFEATPAEEMPTESVPSVQPADVKIPGGKYAGKTIGEVLYETDDTDYVRKIATESKREDVRNAAKQVLLDADLPF